MAIAAATRELLVTGEYTYYKPTINGAYEVQLTQLCEELYHIMAFVSDSALADREDGIDEIVHLVCATEENLHEDSLLGEGLL